MRVLHVVPGISPNSGGPTNIRGLLRGLARQHVDATLVTTDADAGGRLEVPLNVLVVQDGVPTVYHHVWRIGGRYGIAPSLLGMLRTSVPQYDLVHIHWLYNFACLVAARAALTAGVPFVVQPRASLDPHMRRRNAWVKSAYLATLGRPLLTRAAAVVFTAEDERACAVYSRRIPEWVVPNGVDMADYAHLPPAGTFRRSFPAVRGPFLLFLGRLSPQKGLDLLLPAFAQLAASHPDHWLVLAGPDYQRYEAEVRALAARLGIAGRVVLTGLLTGPAKLAAFVDADLFVLPSYAENFGSAIVEALACGLPVVISDRVNIHRELVEAGVATVVRCTVDSVAAGLVRALADPAARERMADAGPRVVRARYSWDAVVPRLVAHYAEAARSRVSQETS